MFKNLQKTYNEYPPRFWIVAAASFVDRVGATLIFPFFALYITQKFGVGMTQAGVLIGVYSFSGLIGSMLGGALTDRFGRRSMVLFGLIFSALSSVSMGLANDLWLFYALAVLVGLLSDIAGPAWQAMVADILPEKQRAEGFGVLRVIGNLAWIVGPTVGGLMAARSYLLLFLLDAVSSLITAAIIYRLIPETRPQSASALGQSGPSQSLAADSLTPDGRTVETLFDGSLPPDGWSPESLPAESLTPDGRTVESLPPESLPPDGLSAESLSANSLPAESLLQTLRGYSKVLADRIYMFYILISMLMMVVYLQMYNALSVYLRDVHGVDPQRYGFILSTSAITVILFQFWVTRRIKHRPPMLMMALGAVFYLVGFSMYGFVSAYALFLLAMVLITIGEMVTMPVGQALAANFAPEDMRGRYMAVFGLSWAIPSTIGPALAGLILDNYNPNYLWYASGILCFLAVLGFLWLHQASRERLGEMQAAVAD